MGFILVLAGLLGIAAGALLIRKFGARATRTGIGSFTLLPLAGLAYLAGCFLVPLGLVFMGIGVGILTGYFY